MPFICEAVGGFITRWHHQMETFSVLLALCVGNSPVTSEFPSERPVTQSFDVFFDLCLNKRLSKQSWGWWFQMPSHSLWHHRNGYEGYNYNLNLLQDKQIKNQFLTLRTLMAYWCRPASHRLMTTQRWITLLSYNLTEWIAAATLT